MALGTVNGFNSETRSLDEGPRGGFELGQCRKGPRATAVRAI